MGCAPSKTIQCNTILVLPNSTSDSSQANNNPNRSTKETENNQLKNSITQTAASNTQHITQAQAQAQKNEALLKAVSGVNLNEIESLISDGADVNTTDKNSDTPLMHAIIKEAILIVDLLLHHQAKLELKNSKKMTALALAITLYNSNKQNSTELNRLAQMRNKNSQKAILQSLFRSKPSIDTLVTEKQQTYIALAIEYNDKTFFDILMQNYDSNKLHKLYDIKDKNGKSANDLIGEETNSTPSDYFFNTMIEEFSL